MVGHHQPVDTIFTGNQHFRHTYLLDLDIPLAFTRALQISGGRTRPIGENHRHAQVIPVLQRATGMGGIARAGGDRCC